MSVDKLIEAYYEWFKEQHPTYSDEQVMWATNKMDIDDFVQYVQEVIEHEFPIEEK